MFLSHLKLTLCTVAVLGVSLFAVSGSAQADKHLNGHAKIAGKGDGKHHLATTKHGHQAHANVKGGKVHGIHASHKGKNLHTKKFKTNRKLHALADMENGGQFAMDDTGAEVIKVTTAGEPRVVKRQPVMVVKLVATPWNIDGRGGVAFRADGIVPVPADPAMNRAPTDAEHRGPIAERLSSIESEQGERAAVGIEVVGGAEQSPESEPLLGCEMNGHDGSPHGEGSPGRAERARPAISSNTLDAFRMGAKTCGKKGSG